MHDGSDNLPARAHRGEGGGRRLVAGARFVSEKKTRPSPWEREIPFKLSSERDLRPGDRPKPRLLRVVGGAKKAKVASW